MVFLFEKLGVYQRALSFADRASTLAAGFSREYWYLADQFSRASLSIALNVAEGSGRGTAMDRRRFLHIARGSAFECVPLVDMCHRKGLLSETVTLEMRAVLVDLSKMLSRMIQRMSPADSVKEDDLEYAP